jgi:hypothetical protein
MDELQVGDVVLVGPAYTMADEPPWAGRGRFVADGWTGVTMRIVGWLGTQPPRMAMLAPADIVDVDESDEVVSINVGRLTLKRSGALAPGA